MIEIHSAGIARLPLFEALLGAPMRRAGPFGWRGGERPHAVAGWGARPSARPARQRARQLGVPYLALEDGFLRSFGTGERFPPLSIVVDRVGIYYDATRACELENMLGSPACLLDGIEDDVRQAMALLCSHRLSKYNHVGLQANGLPPAAGRRRVLVVDQTVGDMSVVLGGATAQTFAHMLQTARDENPGALVHVKTHPEVVQGRKPGYLAHIADDTNTVVLRHDMNPLALIEQMDRVYVVTSQMGFEALLVDKPVTCFGIPWYAGWGQTDDRQACPRRGRARGVDELFAAAYFYYARYLDPVSHQRGTIFDVIDWLVRQRSMDLRLPRRLICVGYRRWKAANLKPMLSLSPERVTFVADAAQARALAPGPDDALAHWGAQPPPGVAKLARECASTVLAMEDGFVRSVGLGSDLIRPLSLVMDASGIYFDPQRESGLEAELNRALYTPAELASAARVRQFIAANGITKYNIEPRRRAAWPAGGREVVLVTGQVEDDASVRLGCGAVCTNLALLAAARLAHPDAFIVYKPHPDVAARNRRGRVADREALQYADHVETRLSVVSCIEACDVLHTMTSLSGFDALLRGKRVVTHGHPFYAGWGLTEDRARIARRCRRLSLDELVAGVLLRYPLYWDWELKGYTTCEAVLRRLAETHAALERQGQLETLRSGYARRQLRKVCALLRGQLEA